MQKADDIPLNCPRHPDNLLSQTEETMRCDAGCTYPIIDGVPRFAAIDNYASAFGEQWKRYRKTQLDSYTGLPISESRLQRCLGDELWSELAGKQILEAGCGAGRFTEVLLDREANVTSIDLSDAVSANSENFPPGAPSSYSPG